MEMNDQTKTQQQTTGEFIPCSVEGCNCPPAFNGLCAFHAFAPAHLFGYVSKVLERHPSYSVLIEDARHVGWCDPPRFENEKNTVYAVLLYLKKKNALPAEADVSERDKALAQLEISPTLNPNRIFLQSEGMYYCIAWVAMKAENILIEEVLQKAENLYDLRQHAEAVKNEQFNPIYKRENHSTFNKLGQRISIKRNDLTGV